MHFIIISDSDAASLTLETAAQMVASLNLPSGEYSFGAPSYPSPRVFDVAVPAAGDAL